MKYIIKNPIDFLTKVEVALAEIYNMHGLQNFLVVDDLLSTHYHTLAADVQNTIDQHVVDTDTPYTGKVEDIELTFMGETYKVSDLFYAMPFNSTDEDNHPVVSLGSVFNLTLHDESHDIVYVLIPGHMTFDTLHDALVAMDTWDEILHPFLFIAAFGSAWRDAAQHNVLDEVIVEHHIFFNIVQTLNKLEKGESLVEPSVTAHMKLFVESTADAN